MPVRPPYRTGMIAGALAATIGLAGIGHYSMKLIRMNHALNERALSTLDSSGVEIPRTETKNYVRAVREYGFSSGEIRSLDSLGMTAKPRVPLHRIALTLKGNLSGNFTDNVISETAKQVYRNMQLHHDLRGERERAARILDVFRNANHNIKGGTNQNLRSALLKIYARTQRR